MEARGREPWGALCMNLTYDPVIPSAGKYNPRFSQEGEPSWGQNGHLAPSLIRQSGNLALSSVPIRDQALGGDLCRDTGSCPWPGCLRDVRGSASKQKAPCSKSIKNLKTKMAEHETNHRSFWVQNLCNCTGCRAMKGTLMGTVPSQVPWGKMTEEGREGDWENIFLKFLFKYNKQKSEWILTTWLDEFSQREWSVTSTQIKKQNITSTLEAPLLLLIGPTILTSNALDYFCLFGGFM